MQRFVRLSIALSKRKRLEQLYVWITPGICAGIMTIRSHHIHTSFTKQKPMVTKELKKEALEMEEVTRLS